MRYPLRLALTIGVAVLLAGCGGSQPPLSVSPKELPAPQSLRRQAYHILHPFGRSAGDGLHPAADLIDVKGTLYGTTVNGGSSGAGTVFSITTGGQETVLHSFARSAHDGGLPMGRLLNVNGTLYGTTLVGGTHDGGTVFGITPDGKEKVIHSFASNYQSGRGNSGSLPEAGLTNVNGTLYGTTSEGGAHACNSEVYCGTVFSITTSGKYTVLHSFGKPSGDGNYPQASLLNVNGTLYGTTAGGGEYTDGTIFSITTAGDCRTVYSFGGNQRDGQRPMSDLIDVQDVLYGTTRSGGNASISGTVFGVTPDGTEKFLFSFAASGSNGSQPVAALKNVKGVLYGTTTMGGVNNLGTVFKLTKSGKETVLHSFGNGSGVNPVAGLVPVAGTLYGTTYGRMYGMVKRSFGNVFSLTP
jgi:uncharacterized repeat protein (TIGR03803 family)